MCGLVGVVPSKDNWQEKFFLENKLSLMVERIKNRGPDKKSVWLDNSLEIGLAFQRLSILDLSEHGSQPMFSETKDWIIVFNGEVYNNKHLKKEAGYWKQNDWKGSSDTEVILEFISRYGFEKTIPKLNGMFAIGAYQKSSKLLWLARDRFGEKPLYYCNGTDGSFLFASEAKCFLDWPFFNRVISDNVVKEYFRFGYVPEPLCVYKNANKVPPGSILRFKQGEQVKLIKYWDSIENFHTISKNSYKGSYEDAVYELSFRLNKSVYDRLRSDVPIGMFLSGGIDSTNIALSMSHSKININSFSVGFENFKFDELPFANKIAKHFSTNHTEIKIDQKECLSVIDTIADIYDEPFSDPSQIPTVLLCKYAKDNITVALSGDGGDELFGGYPRYKTVANRWKKSKEIPFFIKKILFKLGNNNIIPDSFNKNMRKISHLNATDLYLDEMSRWRPDENISTGNINTGNLCHYKIRNNLGSISLERMYMLKDIISYLPSNLLVKMDRASMAFGLEVRSPFLDHDLVEFCWSLPDEYTVKDGEKGILKSLLLNKLPKNLIDRPKKGFEPPLFDWLSGPLLEWAGDTLFSGKERENSIYNKKIVRRKFDKLIKGQRRWTYKIWTIIMYEAWKRSVNYSK